MLNRYDEDYTICFLKGLKNLTGISYRKLEQYASQNNVFNILEHPNTIDANQQQLEKISLLNEFISTYRLLKLQEDQTKIILNSSNKAGEYFSSILSGIKDREKFMVAFLDAGNSIIETKTMSEGSLGEAVVYPRNILKTALDCDCKSLVLAHNHPGGFLKASQQDLEVTQRLISVFSLVEISVLDHVIVTGSSYYSMAEQGLMPEKNPDKANCNPIYLSKRDKVSQLETEFVSKSDSKIESETEFKTKFENEFNFENDSETEFENGFESKNALASEFDNEFEFNSEREVDEEWEV